MKQSEIIHQKLHNAIASIECLYDIYYSEFSSKERNLLILTHTSIDNLLIAKFPEEHEKKHGKTGKEIGLTTLKNQIILLNKKYNND